jgi:hypothetical protein
MAKSMVHEARKRWPSAIWIVGNGRYASAACCAPGATVMLFETPYEAELAKRQIDETGCGGGCRGAGWHEIVDLYARQRSQ